MLQSILIEYLNAMKKRVSLLRLRVDRELCHGWEHGSLSESAEVHFGAVRLIRPQRVAAVRGLNECLHNLCGNTGGTTEMFFTSFVLFLRDGRFFILQKFCTN